MQLPFDTSLGQSYEIREGDEFPPLLNSEGGNGLPPKTHICSSYVFQFFSYQSAHSQRACSSEAWALVQAALKKCNCPTLVAAAWLTSQDVTRIKDRNNFSSANCASLVVVSSSLYRALKALAWYSLCSSP